MEQGSKFETVSPVDPKRYALRVAEALEAVAEAQGHLAKLQADTRHEGRHGFTLRIIHAATTLYPALQELDRILVDELAGKPDDPAATAEQVNEMLERCNQALFGEDDQDKPGAAGAEIGDVVRGSEGVARVFESGVVVYREPEFIVWRDAYGNIESEHVGEVSLLARRGEGVPEQVADAKPATLDGTRGPARGEQGDWMSGIVHALYHAEQAQGNLVEACEDANAAGRPSVQRDLAALAKGFDTARIHLTHVLADYLAGDECEYHELVRVDDDTAAGILKDIGGLFCHGADVAHAKPGDVLINGDSAAWTMGVLQSKTGNEYFIRSGDGKLRLIPLDDAVLLSVTPAHQAELDAVAVEG